MNKIQSLPETVYCVEGPGKSRTSSEDLVYLTAAQAQADADSVNSRQTDASQHRGVYAVSRKTLADRAKSGDLHWLGLATEANRCKQIFVSQSFRARADRGDFYEW